MEQLAFVELYGPSCNHRFNRPSVWLADREVLGLDIAPTGVASGGFSVYAFLRNMIVSRVCPMAARAHRIVSVFFPIPVSLCSLCGTAAREYLSSLEPQPPGKWAIEQGDFFETQGTFGTRHPPSR
jgi:hypothetical protein